MIISILPETGICHPEPETSSKQILEDLVKGYTKAGVHVANVMMVIAFWLQKFLLWEAQQVLWFTFDLIVSLQCKIIQWNVPDRLVWLLSGRLRQKRDHQKLTFFSR